MPDWRRLVRDRIPAAEPEQVEEMAQHLEQAYQAALNRGDVEADAHAAALRLLPDGPVRWTGVPLDVKLALRRMIRQPGWTAMAALAIALGAGGCTAIFSLLEAVILRPLDYHDPGRLVMVWENNYLRIRKQNVVAPGNLRDWIDRNTVFESLCPVLDRRIPVLAGGEPEELRIQMVGPQFLSVLGVRPALGRDLTPEDARPGAALVVLISHSLWLRKFGGDPGVIGRGLTGNGQMSTIVGVLPAGFRSLDEAPDLLVPFYLNPAVDYRKTSGRFLRVIGRMKPDVVLDRAQGEMSAIARNLESEFPDFDKGWGVMLVPLAEHFAASAQKTLWVLMSAVGLVLLIACANVANLLLARSAARERELAIRASLGARAGRLVRQLLTESFLLALAGGVGGALLAVALVRAFRLYAPAHTPRMDDAGLHWPVLLFALLLVALTTILFGLAPAWISTRLSLAGALKEGGRSMAGAARTHRLLNGFVVAEVALSLVLLTGAGLLLRSFLRLASVDPGFRSQNVLTMSVNLPSRKYSEDAKVIGFFRELNERVRRLPGVRSASSITFLPFTGLASATGFRVEGRPEPKAGEVPVCDVRIVQPGYFETMGMRLLRGRAFNEADNSLDAPMRFVVSETLAKTMFPGEDPLLHRISVEMGRENPPGEIIGVVADILHYGLDVPSRPMVYYPHAKLPFSFMTVVARTEGPPESFAPALMAVLREMDPEQPAAEVRSMDEWISRSLASPRWLGGIVLAFASVALLLALVGVYGVMSYSVAERTHEIGVRLALGAEPSLVRGMMLRRGLWLTCIGIGAGLAGSWAAGQLIGGMLFGVRPLDALTYALAISLLLIAATLACWLPARRATRVDPLVALRYE